MAKAVVPREFSKLLKDLARSGRVGKQAALKAEAACTQINLHGEIRLERTHHGESRVDCEKYDLGDGYRLVTQRIGSGADAKLVMLFVGSHDDADAWLNRHKGYVWVKKDSDGKVDFIQVSGSEAELSLPQVEVSISTPEHVLEEPLITGLTDDEIALPGFDAETLAVVRGTTKGDWGEGSAEILESIEKSAGMDCALLVLDVFTMADRGDLDGVRQRLRMSARQAHEVTQAELIEAISLPQNAETFFTWTEDDSLPDASDREEWMLYLHPEQAKIASADLSGPARLRGVSGSGKTCVLVHRARFIAKKYGEPVLVVTLTESMRKLLEGLIISLCGAERARITVATVSSVARDVIRKLHPESERWYTMADLLREAALDEATSAVKAATAEGTQGFGRLSHSELRHFLDDEISFVRTRLLQGEYETYATSAFRRVGRGQALGEAGRRSVLVGIRAYDQYLRDAHRLDHEGVVQTAVEVLSKLGQKSPEYRWRAVLADEVQDLSQNEVRMLAELRNTAGESLKTAADGLFFVGDGAQTIYKRGFSLQSLGIQLSRSHVFKKNYRNTFEILQAAYGLIRDYEFADVDEDNRQKPLTPDFAARRGDRPVLARCRGLKAEADYAVSVIEQLRDLNGDSALSDTCVISRSKAIRSQISEAMRLKRIPYFDLKTSASLDVPGVKVSTVESAKGFEFGTVILAGVSEAVEQPLNDSEFDADPVGNAAKLYVAMTRARNCLHITYTSNAERRPADALESIRKWCDEVRFENGRVSPIRADAT